MFEDLPRPKPASEFPRKLDGMSIEELQDYISALKGEIGRVETDMTKKKASRDVAASVFKS